MELKFNIISFKYIFGIYPSLWNKGGTTYYIAATDLYTKLIKIE